MIPLDPNEFERLVLPPSPSNPQSATFSLSGRLRRLSALALSRTRLMIGLGISLRKPRLHRASKRA